MNIRTFHWLVFAIGVLAVSMIAPNLRSHADDAEPQTVDAASQPKAYLGTKVSPVPKLLSMHLPDLIDPTIGVMIVGVDAGSPADLAGLQKGDIILEFDDAPLTIDTLTRKVNQSKVGDVVSLRLIRGGKPQTVKVSLAARPNDLASDSMTIDLPKMSMFEDADGSSSMRKSMREAMQKLDRDMKELQEKMGELDFGGMIPDMPNVPAMPNIPGAGPNSAWSKSTSSSNSMALNMEKISGDRYSATLKYQTDDGEKREWTMEGTLDQIRDAAKQEEMPDAVRRQLNRSIQMQKSGKFDFSSGFSDSQTMRALLDQFTGDDVGMGNVELPMMPPVQRL